MSPVSHWYLLGVVSFGNSGSQFVISGSLQAPPGAVLDNKLLILLSKAHGLAVLSLHHTAPDGILEVVHPLVRGHVCCLEHPLLTGKRILPFLLSELSSDFVKDL